MCECVCVTLCVQQKRSRNQLQLFSVDNVIKLKAAAHTPAAASYLGRMEIYKRKESSAHRKKGPEWDSAARSHTDHRGGHRLRPPSAVLTSAQVKVRKPS